VNARDIVSCDALLQRNIRTQEPDTRTRRRLIRAQQPKQRLSFSFGRHAPSPHVSAWL